MGDWLLYIASTRNVTNQLITVKIKNIIAKLRLLILWDANSVNSERLYVLGHKKFEF